MKKSNRTTLHYVIQNDGARDLVLPPLGSRGMSHPTRKSGALKWFLVVSGSAEKVIMREANTVTDFNWRVYKWRAG